MVPGGLTCVHISNLVQCRYKHKTQNTPPPFPRSVRREKNHLRIFFYLFGWISGAKNEKRKQQKNVFAYQTLTVKILVYPRRALFAVFPPRHVSCYVTPSSDFPPSRCDVRSRRLFWYVRCTKHYTHYFTFLREEKSRCGAHSAPSRDSRNNSKVFFILFYISYSGLYIIVIL